MLKKNTPLLLGLSVFIMSLCLSLKTQAGNIDKAYDALKIYDYFKARKCFYQALKKHSVAAGYGLALIYYRTDNPFHQYDSAFRYVEISRSAYHLLKKEEKTELEKKYALSETTLNSLRDSVHFYSYRALLRKPKTVGGIDSFLLHQPGSLYHIQLVQLRDSLALLQLQELNTSEAYQRFIRSFPESALLPLARLKQEKALYTEYTLKKRPEDYDAFILHYPKSSYVGEAENNIFSWYTERKDVRGLYQSVKKYPGNKKNVEAAWKLIYTLSVPEYSPQSLDSFLEKFPDFPYRQSIEQEIALLNLKLFPIRQDNHYGFIDSTGTPYVLPFLDGVEEFSEGLCAAEFNGRFGYVGKTGEVLISFKFESAESFKHGLAIVQYAGKSALIDRTGNYIAQGYDDIADFSEGIAIVSKNGKQGGINNIGNLVIDMQYEKIGDFSEGQAWVLKNGKYGYIDKQGDLSIANIFEWAESFKNRLARVKFNNKFGLINTRGDFVLKPEYDRIEQADENIYLLVKGTRYGFAERSGCLLTEIGYEYSSRLKPEEMTDGKWLHLITEDGENLVNMNGKKFTQDDEVEEMALPKGGFVRFMQNDKYGFMEEKSRQVVIRPVYDEAEDFNGRLAIVRKKDNVLLIDQSNKIIFSDKIDELEWLDDHYLLTTKNNLNGLLNKSGKVLLNAELNAVEVVSPHLVKLERQGKMAYFDCQKAEFIWKEKGF